MVVPTLAYCGVFNLNLTTKQTDKLASFHNRAITVIRCKTDQTISIPSRVNLSKLRACEIVRKCLKVDEIEDMNTKFTRIMNSKSNRNNRYLLRIPKIRTRYEKRLIFFTAAIILNELPIEF